MSRRTGCKDGEHTLMWRGDGCASVRRAGVPIISRRPPGPTEPAEPAGLQQSKARPLPLQVVLGLRQHSVPCNRRLRGKAFSQGTIRRENQFAASREPVWPLERAICCATGAAACSIMGGWQSSGNGNGSGRPRAVSKSSLSRRVCRWVSPKVCGGSSPNAGQGRAAL